MTFLSVIGLGMMAYRNPENATILAIWLCLYPIIYYLVQFEDRYRYPIMWVTFLLGAVPISFVLERLWNSAIGALSWET